MRRPASANLPSPAILIVTERTLCGESLESRAEALFRGGCRWLSLREKDLPAAERLALLIRLMEIGARFDAIVGIHGDLQAAASRGCALHLGADGDPAAARRVLGDPILIGQSCHTQAELDRAGASEVDYVTLGPPFASTGKPGYGPVLPLDAFRSLAATAAKPVVALGGVGESTVARLADIELAGIAVMGEAMQTPDPAAWFHRLAGIWGSIHPGKRG